MCFITAVRAFSWHIRRAGRNLLLRLRFLLFGNYRLLRGLLCCGLLRRALFGSTRLRDGRLSGALFRRMLRRGTFLCLVCFGNVFLHGGFLRGGRFRLSLLFLWRFRLGRLLRQFVVVSSSGMCGMILIGVEQIAQALHALALFARFTLLLLLFKKFALGMAH